MTRAPDTARTTLKSRVNALGENMSVGILRRRDEKGRIEEVEVATHGASTGEGSGRRGLETAAAILLAVSRDHGQ
jgi:hypothetical protein